MGREENPHEGPGRAAPPARFAFATGERAHYY